jgi:hypothetical protein
MPRLLQILLAVTLAAPLAPFRVHAAAAETPLHLYQLPRTSDARGWDEAVAAATVQGILNRSTPRLYLLAPPRADTAAAPTRPQYWLDLLSRDGGWLAGRPRTEIRSLDELVRIAGGTLKGAIIWDPAVPATANVATTLAGVHDAVVLSPELAAAKLGGWKLPVIADLRGRFTGAETGSAKNDAYRWAIREYLATGRCSSRYLALQHDAWSGRSRGQIDYVVNRDRAVRERAFVFDLSPWGDETPADDRAQRLGLDLETYHLMLAEIQRHAKGQHFTELAGFFVFNKYSNWDGNVSRHEPVPTEWETVRTISPYNVYQNTATGDAYNQSLHIHAPRRPLTQDRRAQTRTPEPGKTYLCILMADYDSTTPLYDFLPKFWDDPNRGKVPLAWGINPNLLEAYPDLIAHFYRTLTPADTITADAGAAGYINPSRIRPENLSLFAEHNRRYFREADLTIAPMVLDWEIPSEAVKDAFLTFAPDGYGAMIWNMHTNSGKGPDPHVWKGMPVINLLNHANEFPGPAKTATIVADAIAEQAGGLPGFYFFRIVWTSPTQIVAMLEELRRQRPALNVEVLDVHTFYSLVRQQLDTPPAPASR